MSLYTIEVDENYSAPEGKIETNEEYLAFVMHPVFASYQKQHNTNSLDEGITAARELYNLGKEEPSPTEEN